MPNDIRNLSDNSRASIVRKSSRLLYIISSMRKNKAAVIGFFVIVLLMVVAIFADKIAPYGYDDQLLSRSFLFPQWKHPMGTDHVGRDILSRIIYGSRVSLIVGIVAVTISVTFGTIVGSIAGFYGGKVDNILMRFIDIMFAIPSILLAISIAAMLGQGLINLMIAVGVSEIPRFSRIVRASILSVKEQEFIEAARAIGASDARIIIKHILPNCIAPMIVQGTLSVGTAILDAAGLSFIGLGIQPPLPDWGGMLSAGRQYIRDYWYIVTFPGLMIMITIYALNLFGDGLRDALDPRLKNN